MQGPDYSTSSLVQKVKTSEIQNYEELEMKLKEVQELRLEESKGVVSSFAVV